MRSIRYILLPFLLLLTFIGQSQYILTLHCTEMDPYIGRNFTVRVTEHGSGWEVGRKIISVDSAAFSIELYVLLEPHSYNLDFYADVNQNNKYDAPPADHAWRRVLDQPVQNTTIEFVADSVFTDINIPESLPYETYDAVWGGKWLNQTFGSTDSIEAGFRVTCDSILGFFKTKGVFGNPAVVEYHSNNIRPADTITVPDTLRYFVDPPWTGDIYFVNGEMHADLAQAPLGFQVTGTTGLKQVLAHYKVLSNGIEFAHGYFYVRELEITSSTDPLIAHVNQLSNISCTGFEDGAIILSGQGGTPEYEYLWSTTDTTSSITSLLPGTYSLTLTDAEGCSSRQSFTITEPSPLSIDDIIVQHNSCFGVCDATVTISASGGTLPLDYDLPTELCEGTFTLTVTDANGCADQEDFVITSPPQILITGQVITNATGGLNNGQIEITVEGGSAPYQYSIDGGAFQTSNTFPNLPVGEHTGQVQDANGCILVFEFEIQDVTAIVEPDLNFSLYPNPVHSVFQLQSDVPVSLQLMDLHGRTLKSFATSNIHAIDVASFAAGTYVLRISNGDQYIFRRIIVE